MRVLHPRVMRPAARIGALAAAAVLGALAVAGCSGEPETVLQTDLPQVPGMTARDSAGLKQADGVVEQGTFAYKGAILDLPACVQDTKAKFTGMGWSVESERQSPATARLVFTKERRRAVVEIIRNDLSPSMSTAVTEVRTLPAG